MAIDKSAIRSRFVAALQDGKTTEEATAIANGTQAPIREAADLPPPPNNLVAKAQDGDKAAAAAPIFKVTKNAKGKFVVQLGKTTVAGPFDTEAQATKARDKAAAAA